MSIAFFVPAQTLLAASLLQLSDMLSAQRPNAESSHRIQFQTPTGINAPGDTIVITFPADFNFTGKDATFVNLYHGATGGETEEYISTTPTLGFWGAAFSGTQNRVLTLTPPADGVGQAEIFANEIVRVRLNPTNALNPSTAGDYIVAISGGFGDTGSILVPIISDDQVFVSATVPQALSFSISDNSVGFGPLSASVSRYATGDGTGSATPVVAHTITASTNASGGYSISHVSGTLTSGAHSIDAIGGVPSSPIPGSEQFGIRGDAAGGKGVMSTRYGSAQYALDASGFPDTFAYTMFAGPTPETTYSIYYLANISSGTEAGEYGAPITYVATAMF